MQHRIVITRHRPWLRAGVIAGSAFALLIAAFALYRYTRSTTVSDFRQARSELESLRDERRELARELRSARAQITTLKEQMVYVERSSDIDTQACESVRSSLASIESEAADLREQLAFYRGIVAPEAARAGLRVLEIKLTPGSKPGDWRYDLVLIQSVRHDRRVAGSIRIVIEALVAGQLRQIPIETLALDPAQTTPEFAFKYFQEFGGEFRLPDGAQPARIRVTLTPSGQGLPVVEDEFEWAKVLAPAASSAAEPEPP